MKKQLTRKMTRLCLLCFMLMGITSCSEQSKVEKAAKQFVTALNMNDMDAVYVSCDYDKTKGSGKLFDFVCQKENIKPEEMIHFGDNYISDYSEAINHGISAFQTPKIVDYEISEKENKYLLSFHKQNDSL